jgi:hypothetical protein
MSNHVASFETIIESVDALSLAELDALQARISHSRRKQAPTTKKLLNEACSKFLMTNT